MSRTIAIVEDEPDIRANYTEAFRRYGYEVEAYPGRAEARIAFSLRLPDLVIIDVGLGDEPEGGFDLCRELRARAPTLPILFLTARDSDLDVISGLRLGADDYLSKAISLPQLTARVQALFRRLEAMRAPSARESVFELRGLRLELERMRVTWRGSDVPLTVTEFWMVHALVRHPDRALTADKQFNDVVEQTVAIMQPQANRERVIIRSSFASRLPDVVADQRSVRQIALNLLSNAVRATPAGGQIIVSTAYEQSGDIVLRVRDTGIGMNEADIETALEPFRQLATSRRGGGTGLGLPLTKALVEANRGALKISSRRGEGTLVEVALRPVAATVR